MAVALPLAALIIPVVVCWLTGTTPAIARMLIGTGLAPAGIAILLLLSLGLITRL
jgi:hypothetical protein